MSINSLARFADYGLDTNPQATGLYWKIFQPLVSLLPGRPPGLYTVADTELLQFLPVN